MLELRFSDKKQSLIGYVGYYPPNSNPKLRYLSEVKVLYVETDSVFDIIENDYLYYNYVIWQEALKLNAIYLVVFCKEESTIYFVHKSNLRAMCSPEMRANLKDCWRVSNTDSMLSYWYMREDKRVHLVDNKGPLRVKALDERNAIPKALGYDVGATIAKGFTVGLLSKTRCIMPYSKARQIDSDAQLLGFAYRTLKQGEFIYEEEVGPEGLIRQGVRQSMEINIKS